MTIKATIIADSLNPEGVRLTTFEMEYPRFIHAEVMTHRMLSKNAASSRAIPVPRMHDNIINDTAMPVHWGKNQAGMKAKEEVDATTMEGAKGVWLAARDSAIAHSKVLHDMGIHKQIVNRVTEFAQTMKIVISGTEWENFFWLRCHLDAQPEFFELAMQARKAMDSSYPKLLEPGEWHLPYISSNRDSSGRFYYIGDLQLTLEEAKVMSASLCAQVSYRKSDDSMEKAIMIYKQLIESTPCHASPVEHQGTPIDLKYILETSDWPEGVTHQRRDGSLWSGNFQGFIQFRQLIPNHTKVG